MVSPRKEHGSGTIYQRGDGMWIGAFDAGTYPNGKRRRVTVSCKGCPGGCPKKCAHRAEIKRRVRDKQRALELAGITEVNPRATVKSWATDWLTIQERKLRPKSYNATRSAVHRWIIPTIGHVRFDALAPAHVRAVEAAQRDAGRSSSTQLRTHSVLMSMLRAAQVEGYPVTDRMLNLDRPEKSISDRAAMSLEQAIAILAVATETPQASRWVAAFLQGMRQGECLGLTWDAVDFQHDEIRLAWQLQPLAYRVPRDRTSGFRIPNGYEVQQVRGRLHLVRPKSKSGERVIPMVALLRAALEAWQPECPTTELGLVWPLADGSPCPSSTDDLEWYGLQQAADVHHPSGRFYTIHEARHTTATLLHELGVEPAIIAAILGQTKLVESYLHVKRSPRVREALESVAGVLNPAS